jgi:hypothetical protein
MRVGSTQFFSSALISSIAETTYQLIQETAQRCVAAAMLLINAELKKPRTPYAHTERIIKAA